MRYGERIVTGCKESKDSKVSTDPDIEIKIGWKRQRGIEGGTD